MKQKKKQKKVDILLSFNTQRYLQNLRTHRILPTTDIIFLFAVRFLEQKLCGKNFLFHRYAEYGNITSSENSCWGTLWLAVFGMRQKNRKIFCPRKENAENVFFRGDRKLFLSIITLHEVVIRFIKLKHFQRRNCCGCANEWELTEFKMRKAKEFKQANAEGRR